MKLLRQATGLESGLVLAGIFLVEVPSLVFIATTTDSRFSYRSVTHEYN